MGIGKKVKRALIGFGGKPKDTPQPKVQADESVRRIQEVMETLKAINFGTSKLPPEILLKKNDPEQSRPDLVLERDALVQMLNDLELSRLDTTEIDKHLSTMAKYFAEGVKSGLRRTTECSVCALRDCVQNIRVDPSDANLIDMEQMQSKCEQYCSQWVQIISLARENDGKEQEKNRQEGICAEYEKDYRQKREEYTAFRATNEGILAEKNLREHINKPSLWTVEANKLYRLLTDAKNARAQAARTRILVFQEEEAIQTNIIALKTIYGQLRPPRISDPNLHARIQETLEQQNRAIAEDQQRTARLIQIQESSANALDALLDDPARTESAIDALKYMDEEDARERQLAEAAAAAQKVQQNSSNRVMNAN